MDKFGVQLHLEEIARAHQEWTKANHEFNQAVFKVLGRVLHEAAINRMSVEEVAKHLRFPRTRVRSIMKRHGLDYRSTQTLLANSAAKALQENAELLGIDPAQMDLTSPLAYLPMGSELRTRLQSEAVQGVTEVELNVTGIYCSGCGFLEDDYLDDDGDSCQACGCAEDLHFSVKLVQNA